MKKNTKAKSMQLMVEAKTEKAIAAIGNIAAAVAAKNGPFEEAWVSQVCDALRKCVDRLEVDLTEQYKRKQPFRLMACDPGCPTEKEEV